MELRVKLKVRDVEIELTQEEAAELYEALRPFASKGKDILEAFKKFAKEHEKQFVPYPYPLPVLPAPRPWWEYHQPYIWCSTNQQMTATYEVLS